MCGAWIGKIANGEIDLPGFQRILKVPGSHYHTAKVYPGRILRQSGDRAREKHRFPNVGSRDRVGPNFRGGIESPRIHISPFPGASTRCTGSFKPKARGVGCIPFPDRTKSSSWRISLSLASELLIVG
jgi:hypothetical protein